jgi:hypothetical protein
MLEELDEGVLRDVLRPFNVVEHQIHGSHHRWKLHGEQQVVFRVGVAHPSSPNHIGMRTESILTPIKTVRIRDHGVLYSQDLKTVSAYLDDKVH